MSTENENKKEDASLEAGKKAVEMVERFERLFVNASADYWTEPAKQCALIACDTVIDSLTTVLKSGLNNDFDIMNERAFWQSVKSHITNI